MIPDVSDDSVDRDALEAVAELAAREPTEEAFWSESKHRRGAGGRWVKSVFGGVEYTGAIRADSRLWGQDQYGHVVGSQHSHQFLGASSRTEPHLLVRVEDPGRDHPSVQDMLDDNPQFSYDQLEFHDMVPVSKVRDAETGRPIPNPEPIFQEIEHERRVADAVESNRRRREALRAQRSASAVSVAPEVRASGAERARASAELMRRMIRR